MIADVFLKRPIAAMVVSIVLVILGSISVYNLPVAQYPEITPPVIQVGGQFIGADATTVEQTVTIPVESQVNGVEGMDYIQTNSTNDGRMTMNVYFKVGTNVDIAATDVQNRVNIALPSLPDEVKRLGLTVRKRNPSILMLVAMYSPSKLHNIEFLDNYTNIFIKDALLRVDGVGDIFTRADDFSMRIWLKPDRLASFGLTAEDVIHAVQSQNIQVAAGQVGAPPQPPWQTFEYIAFLNGRLSRPGEFGNIIVKSNPSTGSLVYLRDVARTELGKFNYAGASYVDGQRAAYLLIFQTPGSNAIATANGVIQKMEQLSRSFPPDVAYMIPFEAVSVVKVSVKEVTNTLIIALLLVMLVVFLFLQTWRAAIIPFIAIPVSIIGTFTFFLPLGFTINKLTLFGFVLAIGIVVDDAIIVTEAIQRYIDEQHLSPQQAARKAMEDISGPVIAIALVLASVFVPAGFIPGIVGKLYQQFAITISISVLISAFVALSLSPALGSMLLRPRSITEQSKGLNYLFFRFNRWFEASTERYSAGVIKAIRNTRYVLVFLIFLAAATYLLLNHKPTAFIPLEDEGRIYITFELPEAASTARTIKVLDKMQEILGKTPGVAHFAALAGLNVVTFSFKSNNGTIFCQLKPWDERGSKALSVNAIMETMRREFSVIKDANVIIIPPPAIPGLGTTAGFTFELQQRESNDDIKAFERVVYTFMKAVNERKEIAKAFTFFNARTPGYSVAVDREKCEKLGVDPGSVFNAVQTFMGGAYINDFTIYNRNFRVFAQADTMYRNDISALGGYYVRNNRGEMLPLSTLVSSSVTENASLLSHFNLYRSAEFNGNAKPGYSSGQALQALEEVAARTLPAGYGYEFSGLSRQEISAGNTTKYIFILSITFVFLFLSVLYESWSVPFAILLAVPLGVFGAILALTFTPSLSDNVYAQIGFVTLIGLAAKNSILIVEFAKVRTDSGMDVTEATMQAVRLRLRPILMTSLAFIFGVLPLAFSSGAGAVARQTIGWTVLGGMMAATALGIFIVPVLFVLISRTGHSKSRKGSNKDSSQSGMPLR